MVTSFKSAMHENKSIIMHHWSYLGSAQSLRGIFTERPVFGHRRTGNLRDKVVWADVHSLESEDKGPQSCSRKNCKHCAVLDISGKIMSKTTGREYSTKSNVTCKSGNLIHCLSCNVCQAQYVGQTKRRLIDRLQVQEHRRYQKPGPGHSHGQTLHTSGTQEWTWLQSPHLGLHPLPPM